MTTLQLVLKEILHRKLNFALSVLAVVTAVALFVGFFTTGQAFQRETTRLMRDMGFNLRIVPKATDMTKFWATGVSEHTMPEEYVTRFTTQKGFSYTHLVATLQKRVPWRGSEVILTGIAPEVSPPDQKKPPMIFTIEPGAVYMGSAVARSSDLKRGDEIDLLGRTFTVARCLSPSGTIDDIRIYASLRDVQVLLDLEGRINEIQALECLCRDRQRTSLEILTEQLAQLIPDAQVIQISNIAKARERQRLSGEEHFAFLVPFIVIVCAAWVGVLAMINVRDRQSEIGILRALGYGSARIACLFLGKAVLVGLIGAAVGFAVGTVLSLRVGPTLFPVTAKSIQPLYPLLVWAVLLAPGFAALSSFIPAMLAVTQDPADVLREE